MNPFVLQSYVSDDLFCDRKDETELLRKHVGNGRNVTLVAPRRVGKTGLIEHFFNQPDIRHDYYTILIDLYATKDMNEMVQVMGKAILNALMSKSKKAARTFLTCVKSLHGGVSFASNGDPEITLGMGNIDEPEIAVGEIFDYIGKSDKPCIIAIDEFQVVATYPGKTAEALLRTYIQHCSNARFIFAGSQRSMMSEMFLSATRPFFQSTTMMSIGVLDRDIYANFAEELFNKHGRHLDSNVPIMVYNYFDGITWYMQYVMNELYSETAKGDLCGKRLVEPAINSILTANGFTYESILFQLPLKQKSLLLAICKAGKATQITSEKFVKQYHLSSASSVQSAIRGLLEKEFVTNDNGVYEVYDKFFALWLRRGM